jgi:hypothetical protein
VRIDGKVEPPLALLGEDEYICRCGECGAEWVRNVTGERTKLLYQPPLG